MLYIRSMAPLVNLCEQARTEGLLALDVEFIRERTYVPKLALIQLAVSDTCALIDPLEVGDLSPLLDLIASPRTLKVLHAAAQDMEVLFWNSDKAPARIFDTQIAAALVGLGEQLSYGHLVASVLGITLPKEETYSDWLQRPLSPAQVTYAVDDVRYLLALHNLLSARLQHMGRVAWAEEEFRKFDAPERYQRHPRALFRRIRRGQTLSSQGLAILRELAEWRDGEAQRRDCPSGSVLRDELLVEIARKAPRTFDDLQRLRGLPAREFERAAAALLQAVAQGLAMAQEDRPQAVRRYRRSQTEELMVKLLDTCLKALCQQHQLAPSCVGTRADLEELVSRYRQGRLATEGSPLLTGWRGALVGQDLLAVLDGRRSVHLEPESGELVLTPRHPGDPSLSDISHT